MDPNAFDAFTYRNGQLCAEEVSLGDLAARYGTPLYVYSRTHFESQYRRLAEALKPLNPLLCYAVKANSNGAVIRTFAQLGAGADVVSGGELFRARRAGVPADRIVFAGVGKTAVEIEQALREGIRCFTVESEPELERISAIAAQHRLTGRVAVRVNPDVDPKTHRHTSTGKKENKFGVDLERARAACARAARLPGLELAGIHLHLGSPIMTIDPYVEALDKVAPLLAELKAAHASFRTLDLGGGLGIPYRPDQAPFDLAAFAEAVIPRVKATGLQLVMEPGRFLVGNGGVLVARVQYVKENPLKNFIIVDAAMNDLIRPALYEAHHEIRAVKETADTLKADLVGPVCESGDFFVRDRKLPAVVQGDCVAVLSAGAYGFAMSSTYNSRGRAAEVMVAGAHHYLVRERETQDDLVRGEHFAGV